ncbi:hypothetical protein ACFFQF_04335 [Haladaptatus pallidirubidus]|uniref:hypothetical protein n=1 Tax=Haladaptatus pallidirubidus TaxID=1008152 RepID=UPI0035EFA0D5
MGDVVPVDNFRERPASGFVVVTEVVVSLQNGDRKLRVRNDFSRKVESGRATADDDTIVVALHSKASTTARIRV